MPHRNHLTVLLHLVLCLPCRLQVFRINTLNPNENLRAAGMTGQFDEARDLVCLGIDLNHESYEKPLVSPQPCQHLQDFTPAAIAREVVVCKEVVVDAVPPVVFANGIRECLNRPKAHLAPLHVNDSAEAAVVRAAPPAVNCAEIRGYETFQV